MYLRATRGIAITVVLRETEGFAESGNSFVNLLIHDMGEYSIRRNGAILDHGKTSHLAKSTYVEYECQPLVMGVRD
jgi:hypothetical protein